MKDLQTKYYNKKPGKYLAKCNTCLDHFLGDKRDFICPSCETEALYDKVRELEKEVARLNKIVANFKNN